MSFRRILPVIVAAVVSCVAAAIAVVRAQAPQSSPAGPFDLAAAENGGRVEWVTSQNFSAGGGGAAMHLIATTPHHYGAPHKHGWEAQVSGLNQLRLLLWGTDTQVRLHALSVRDGEPRGLRRQG